MSHIIPPDKGDQDDPLPEPDRSSPIPTLQLVALTTIGDVDDVVLSPRAEYALVRYSDSHPRLYDLRRAGVVDAIRITNITGSKSEPIVLYHKSLVKTPIQQPVAAAAFRSNLQGKVVELAVAGLEDDECIYRLNPRTGKPYPPGLATSPASLSYSSSGKYLVVGSTTGEVSVFDVENSDDEPRLVRCHQFAGAILYAAMNQTDSFVYVTTNNNLVAGFRMDNDDTSSFHIGGDEGDLFRLQKCKAIACHPDNQCVIFTDSTPEFWLGDMVDEGQVTMRQYRTQLTDGIVSAEYVPGTNDVVFCGPTGAELWRSYHRADMQRSLRGIRSVRSWTFDDQDGRTLRARMYDGVLCLARLLN